VLINEALTAAEVKWRRMRGMDDDPVVFKHLEGVDHGVFQEFIHSAS
jgi:hypothetical protein